MIRGTNTFDALRLARGSQLRAYARRNVLLQELDDNVRFAEHVARAPDVEPSEGHADYVLYHGWLPGFFDLDRHQARTLLALRQDQAAVPDAVRTAWSAQMSALGWGGDSAGVDIDALVERTSFFLAMQNPFELRELLRRVEQRKPKVIVEIGTARGGLLYCVAQLAARDALIVSIDYPGGPYGGGPTRDDDAIFASFAAPGQKMTFIRERSFHLSSRRALEAALRGRPVDLLIIDGDRSYGGTWSDFRMYGSLVGPGGVVAIHDICGGEQLCSGGCEVSEVWKELRVAYRTEEIVDPDASPLLHPRDAQCPAMGFGLVHV